MVGVARLKRNTAVFLLSAISASTVGTAKAICGIFCSCRLEDYTKAMNALHRFICSGIVLAIITSCHFSGGATGYCKT